jgi:hypothetical protein
MNRLSLIQIHYELVSIHPNTRRTLLGASTSVHSPFTLTCTTLVKNSTPYPETKSFVKKKTLSCAKETPQVQCFISQQISVQDKLSLDKGFFFPSILWGRSTSDHLQEDLAKFGYRSKSKVEFSWNPIGTMYTILWDKGFFQFCEVGWLVIIHKRT